QLALTGESKAHWLGSGEPALHRGWMNDDPGEGEGLGRWPRTALLQRQTQAGPPPVEGMFAGIVALTPGPNRLSAGPLIVDASAPDIRLTSSDLVELAIDRGLHEHLQVRPMLPDQFTG